MKEGEPLIKGKEALADAYADSRSNYPLDRWEALHDGYLQGYKDAEKDIKERILELIEEEEKFWDDGEMIFRKLKKELNEI